MSKPILDMLILTHRTGSFDHRGRLVCPKISPSVTCLTHFICSGIGLESSILFAQEGANVLLVDVNLPAAEKVQKLIADRFPNVKSAAFKADVGKEEDVKAAVDKAVELFGRLDVMVRSLMLGYYTDNINMS